MAEEIPINRLPNQETTFYYNGNTFTIHLYQWRNLMYADILMNGNPVAQGARCMPNDYVIQKATSTNIGGNFKFICVDNEYPFWTLFNKSQRLEFIPDEEM